MRGSAYASGRNVPYTTGLLLTAARLKIKEMKTLQYYLLITIMAIGCIFSVMLIYINVKRIIANRRRFKTARAILLALLSNPERYKYIAGLVESNKITQDQANEKNISKAY